MRATRASTRPPSYVSSWRMAAFASYRLRRVTSTSAAAGMDRGSVALKRALDLAGRLRPSLGSGLVVVAPPRHDQGWPLVGRTTLHRPRVPSNAADAASLREVVVCSLEPWDDVWRRNQFLVDELLRRNPCLRVLFVEPAADVLFDVWMPRISELPRSARSPPDGRLRAFVRSKPFPRNSVRGSFLTHLLRRQVLPPRGFGGFHASSALDQRRDVRAAHRSNRLAVPLRRDRRLVAALRLAEELERLRRLDDLALQKADEVVVCSRALAATRGERRPVSLIPNGVDVEHFRSHVPVRRTCLPGRPRSTSGRSTSHAWTSTSS